MPKDLERDLGLYATVTVSMGAMIGSGIFVLPGKAAAIAGPAVVLAYLLAGVLVLPAALSKAEMATAMPEAGGTYLYIDRAMGPLPGTIAGVGAWFSLVFKSAFALVGLGSYLLLLVEVPDGLLAAVSLGLAVLLLLVNVVGVEQSGTLQAAIVTLVVLSLVGFIADGMTFVEQARYHPFWGAGPDGLFAATGFVFVSYAGVTKIASIAEEVEDPGRNIPLGIVTSVLVMMVAYTLVVFVVVGVAPAPELEKSLTPMALAAGAFAGRAGELWVAVVAVLALTSMANAGILSSTRFPLAMSRDDLAPPALGEISERYRTPVYSIAFTGVLLVALVAFVPVVQLAKLASAFQILVFAFVNAALVAFRESGLESYDPEWVAPGYPWVQLFGIAGGGALLTQMGPLPLAGAVGLVALGALWYRVYGRERTDREGAALDAIRRTSGKQSVDLTREHLVTGGGGGALVAVGPGTGPNRVETLFRVAEPVVGRRGGQVHVVRFEAVPDQVSLSSAAEATPGDEAFEGETGRLAADCSVPVTVDAVVSHDVERAVANYAERTGVNLVIGAHEPEFRHARLLGEDVDWYMDHLPCDALFVRDRGLGEIDEVAVVADEGPYDPLEVVVADAVAHQYGASLRFLYAVGEDASDEQVEAVAEYHERIRELCSVPATRVLVRSPDRLAALVEGASTADLTVVGTAAHHIVYDVVFGTLPDRLADELPHTVLLAHTKQRRRHTFLRYLLDRFVF